MFKIESYVTPILLSYIDKYVRDFRPADTQVSLWDGGLVLHNLVLKADVLQQELALPFTLVSGRIHELRIQVSWTKIMSEPILVTIDTIECVLSLAPPPASSEQTQDSPSRRAQVVEAPPGYMQALVRRIVSNISLRVKHLIVKYVQDDIIMSLNVKYLNVDSAGPDWKPAFADIDQYIPVVRRLVLLDDVTLCLDRADSDGRIRFFHEPLLYRCQLELRVLTKLVSANTRRASSLNIQVRSSKLGWSITTDQLLLLLHLVQGLTDQRTAQPAPDAANVSQAANAASSNIAEPARSGSWSEWAWSWMPSWSDRVGGPEEVLMLVRSTPISISVYLDEVTCAFKVMESESGVRRRSRVILEVMAAHTAVKSHFDTPTVARFKMGVRDLTVLSHGSCVCGHRDHNSLQNEPTVYLRKIGSAEDNQPWSWPQEEFPEPAAETVQAPQDEESTEQHSNDQTSENQEREETDFEQPAASDGQGRSALDNFEFWQVVAPLASLNYIHERTPPMHYADPYENPPTNFQHSDWVENCIMKIKFGDMELSVCMGLIHRLTAFMNVFKDRPYVPTQEPPMRVLTVEECEALYDNLPQRRIVLIAKDVHVRIKPWDHDPAEKHIPPPLILDLYLPKTAIFVYMPLYPHRVCSAACQLLDDAGPVWEGARLRVSVSLVGVEAGLCAVGDGSDPDAQPRQCARVDLRLVAYRLLNDYLFTRRESVLRSYTLRIREINIFGSAARVRAAYEIVASLVKKKESMALRYTKLPSDAIRDEDAVMIDVCFEEIMMRAYFTKNVNTYSISLLSARGIVHQERDQRSMQAWIFSAPDTASTAPYFRALVQWCWEPMLIAPDYAGLWIQSTAISVDPLVMAWLAYVPQVQPTNFQNQPKSSKSVSTSQMFSRPNSTPPSTLKGVVRTGSGAELVHGRTRSSGSISEPSERLLATNTVAGFNNAQATARNWWEGEQMYAIYERVRHAHVAAEVSAVLVYFTLNTVSATDSGTLRDAMERHATSSQRVLVVSLGSLLLSSSTIINPIWADVNELGPTFIVPGHLFHPDELDGFPWRLKLSEVSCYALEVRAASGRKERSASGLRSQLKMPCVVTPRMILELVSTTVTMALVTKTLDIETIPKVKVKPPAVSPNQARVKYFMAGIEFQPHTMLEFMRGPARRSKSPTDQGAEPSSNTEKRKNVNSTIVSIGLNIYADTPPIIVKLEHDQVHLVAAAFHALTHIITILQQPPLSDSSPGLSTEVSHRLLTSRTVSEMEEMRNSSESNSVGDVRSELISIYQAHSENEGQVNVRTFFWFQWVIGHVAMAVSSHNTRLTFDVDDILTTVDLHRQYSQTKIKLASASIKHFQRTPSTDWLPSLLGGRVLDVQEPRNASSDSNFITITITEAQISKLPSSWKEELHPKLLEKKSEVDAMWEIFTTMAPIEIVLQPLVVEQLLSIMHEMAPRSSCPLENIKRQPSPSPRNWPFLYLDAGGFRLLLTCAQEDRVNDDTILFEISQICGNPHPENPICRTPVLSPLHPNWTNNTKELEGRQYELRVHDIALSTAQFRQISHETSNAEIRNGTAAENPALRWSLPTVSPVVTSMLQPMNLVVVVAPTVFVSGTMLCSPAAEVNFATDCLIDVSVDQLALFQRFAADIIDAVSDESGIIFDEDKQGVCPYATFLPDDRSTQNVTQTNDEPNTEETSQPCLDTASSVDDALTESSSHSVFKPNKTADDLPLNVPDLSKKSVSIVVPDQPSEAAQFTELFVTLGVVDVSLYVADDDSPDTIALRPPDFKPPPSPEPPVVQGRRRAQERRESRVPDDLETHVSSRSISESTRNAETGRARTELTDVCPARRNRANLPLFHITVQQPNFYYSQKKSERSVQVSIFNIWMGLGLNNVVGYWNEPLLSTTRGAPDPATEVPPALFTMKIALPPVPANGSVINMNSKGNISIDIERPIMVDVSADRIVRLNRIQALVKKKLEVPKKKHSELGPRNKTWFYSLRQIMESQGFDAITLQTSQIGCSGSEGTFGWDGVTLQVAIGSRPDRLVVFGTVVALVVAVGPPGDHRHVLLKPLMLGFSIDATWEGWRRMEGGVSAREPTVLIGVEADSITLDLRPDDVAALHRIQESIRELFGKEKQTPAANKSSDSVDQDIASRRQSSLNLTDRQSATSAETLNTDCGDHYYKDDLRSGAFKIVEGDQLPVAYQVTLHENCITWKYPHPRTITRLVAFPIPEVNEETDCVLEFYDPILCKWKSHTYFTLPVYESREANLYIAPPEAVFASMWRFRVCCGPRPAEPHYEFDVAKFLPRNEPLKVVPAPGPPAGSKYGYWVSAEQLAGILRVDSYFAPGLLPRTKLVLQLAMFELNLHNALPKLSSQSMALEGFYVSQPLIRSHRVLAATARDCTAHAHMGSPAGAMLLLDAKLSTDMLDCTTGAMVLFTDKVRTHAALSFPEGAVKKARGRMRMKKMRVALHVPRLRTLQSLIADWQSAIKLYRRGSEAASEAAQTVEEPKTVQEVAAALEGRVSLWIHNSTATPLRFGQDGTEELVPLASGVRVSYRWQKPTAKRRLRFALAGPATDWRWSRSIPLLTGTSRVRLEDAEVYDEDNPTQGSGVFLHAKVTDTGAQRSLHLSGRLVLGNLLRQDVEYKVRARGADSDAWQTVASGSLPAETVGTSVLCAAECQLILKLKFMTGDGAWSGDIPLRECPKEDIPWLVKVPLEEDMPYASMWCRVTRARGDGRLLACLWPLYAARSHLPLDAEVLVQTTAGLSFTDLSDPSLYDKPKPQELPGQGATSQLTLPGTTAARHTMSLQYKYLQTSVSCETIPLHYSMADTTVFPKQQPVNDVDDLLNEIVRWLHEHGESASRLWPFSIVSELYHEPLKPSPQQPRTDVVVKYLPVSAGAGCCLLVQFSPVVLLCNATPLRLTLRSGDTVPLCTLDPGTVVAPPSAIVRASFYFSVETGRDTYVSGQMEIFDQEIPPYKVLLPGQVALDRTTEFVIQCNQKLALLNLYYEIKEDINVLGVNTTYMLINRLDTKVLVSPMAVPSDKEYNFTLRPTSFIVAKPTPAGSVNGTPLPYFGIRDRWGGVDPSQLRPYLCLALPVDPSAESHHTWASTVPVRLGNGQTRRSVALLDCDNRSVPVAVTQFQHEGRWLVSIARDPSPQYAVYNRTRVDLAVAEPLHLPDEPSSSRVMAKQECAGTRWWCVARSNSAVHYSSPSYCARYPLPRDAPARPYAPHLVIAEARDEGEMDWCHPVPVNDGEQLLQLRGDVTVKMRVRTHPHSTRIELSEVAQDDISASDIRRRLHGVVSSATYKSFKENLNVESNAYNLESTGAEPQLLDRSTTNGKAMSLRPSGAFDNASVPTIPPKRPPGGAPPLPAADAPSADRADIWDYDSDSSCDTQPSIVMFHEKMSKQSYNEEEDLITVNNDNLEGATPEPSYVYLEDIGNQEWDEADSTDGPSDRFRFMLAALTMEMSSSIDTPPLVALHVDRIASAISVRSKETKAALSVGNVQVDNMHYDTYQYDFAVVASTGGQAACRDPWSPISTIFLDRDLFAVRQSQAKLLLTALYEKWKAINVRYRELTEVSLHVGPISLYVEDSFMKALLELYKMAFPLTAGSEDSLALAEESSLVNPLRLRTLHIDPLNLTLTLHTAVHMYIALDQSPLRLSSFRLQDMVTSSEQLTHLLTVHYLSAAILSAGWVVGGLELLGAPGALAARVGSATGGVRGVAAATAAAVVRSVTCWAGSLARNLDLLAGDEEHARRSAEARRRPPPTLGQGLLAGITNFAINILGAVGGLAHHPLVGVATGESGSSATALRRSLVGAVAKPLSATADLLAFAGQGLLRQAGWDDDLECRMTRWSHESHPASGWRRDCVRWLFRLTDQPPIAAFDVLIDDVPFFMLITHRYLVVADIETEVVMESIPLRHCVLAPYQPPHVQISVYESHPTKAVDTIVIDDEEEFQVSAAAMARVARYAGSQPVDDPGEECRVLTLLPPPGRSYTLQATLAAALHHNADSHFSLL